jgi:hypothetical protein
VAAMAPSANNVTAKNLATDLRFIDAPT